MAPLAAPATETSPGVRLDLALPTEDMTETECDGVTECLCQNIHICN